MADGETHLKYINLGWLIIIPLGIIMFLIKILGGEKYSYLYPLFIYYNYFLCQFIDPDADQISITSAEGRIMRLTKKFWVGLFGAIFVSYQFIYAYLIGLVGGHRSIFSHGWVLGTIGRMIFFNAPLILFIYYIYLYATLHWNAPKNATLESIFFWNYLKIYLQTQFLTWMIGDGIHLILDTEFAKGTLYTPIKTTQR